MNFQYLDTPIGTLRLLAENAQLVNIEFAGQYGARSAVENNDTVLAACAAQLTDYFAGKRRHFDLPLAPQGSPFQLSVWAALANIPFGQVRSYRDIAQSIGNPAAVRAVGAANGRNPLPIVVPCHRVIGSNGALTGFAGGLEVKRFLLDLERATGALRQAPPVG
jgi:methylated-DNA-[protein]-cysteine S-methyltransferase